MEVSKGRNFVLSNENQSKEFSKQKMIKVSNEIKEEEIQTQKLRFSTVKRKTLDNKRDLKKIDKSKLKTRKS